MPRKERPAPIELTPSMLFGDGPDDDFEEENEELTPESKKQSIIEKQDILRKFLADPAYVFYARNQRQALHGAWFTERGLMAGTPCEHGVQYRLTSAGVYWLEREFAKTVDQDQE